MKPSFFKLKDFLVFGLISIFSIIGTIIVFMAVQPVSQAHYMMLVVTALFIGLYIRFLFIRKADLAPFTWVQTKHFGLMVDFEKYKGTQEELVKECEEITDKWYAYYGTKNVFSKKDVVWVWFEKIPMHIMGNNNTKVAGYTVFYTSQMHAGYNDINDEISKTSFAHELGHVIQGKVTGEWDQEKHHEIAKQANLP